MITVKTDYLEAIIYESQTIKLIIYKDGLIPNWDAKQMAMSCEAVDEFDFTDSYVTQKVYCIYNQFPVEQIADLLDKVEKANIHLFKN